MVPLVLGAGKTLEATSSHPEGLRKITTSVICPTEAKKDRTWEAPGEKPMVMPRIQGILPAQGSVRRRHPSKPAARLMLPITEARPHSVSFPAASRPNSQPLGPALPSQNNLRHLGPNMSFGGVLMSGAHRLTDFLQLQHCTP